MVNVRRKLLALLSAVALTACASSAAFAEGFGVYEWSAAGTAMGEAYMFGEEDPSVLAYNPAQITKLDGTYFSIGASLVNPDTKVLFRQLGPLVGGHGQNEVWENEYDPAVIPYMYYVTKAGENSWWGIAMFSRFGNQIEYDDLWPGRYDTIFSGIKGFTVQPTYAFKIGDKLSAAVGLDINYVKLRMRKSLPGAALAPGMGIGDIGTDLEGDTVNVGWLASLMYDFNEKTSLAVTYRSRIKHTMDDADIAFGMGGMGISTGASGTVTLPDSVSIGLGHKFNDRTRVELNAVWTNWETYRDLDIYFNPVPTISIPSIGSVSLPYSKNEKNWEACWRYGIGIEHKLSKQWSILAGYVFDESPIPDSTMDFTVPTGDRHRGSLGFKYRFKENHEIVFAYTGIWADSRETQSRVSPGADYQSSEIFDGFTQVISLGYTIKLK